MALRACIEIIMLSSLFIWSCHLPCLDVGSTSGIINKPRSSLVAIHRYTIFSHAISRCWFFPGFRCLPLAYKQQHFSYRARWFVSSSTDDYDIIRTQGRCAGAGAGYS
jgi:hypothetical protein